MGTQWRRLNRQTQTRFRDQLLVGLRNGESSQRIATRISGGVIDGVQVKGLMTTTRGNARTLVRTGSNAVLNQSRLQSMQQNNEMIDAIQQISTLDSRTSHICIAYSGAAWDVNTLEPIGEGTLPFNSGPPRHFNCRSTIVPVLKSFEDLGLPPAEFPEGTRASIDGQLPGDITFDEFLRQQTAKFQDELLGPARAKLWRDDRITLTQLVDMRGNPMTLDQLESLSARPLRPRKFDPKTEPFTTTEAWRKKFDDPDASVESVLARGTPEQRQQLLEFENRISQGIDTETLHKVGGEWTPERQKLHKEIFEKIFSPEAIAKATPVAGEAPTVTIFGGRGGSGKSFLSESPNAPVNPNKNIILNADDIKDLLPEYEGWNAALVHEESSYLLKRAEIIARERRLNTVLDTTIGNPEKAARNLTKYSDAGYEIEGYYMHLPRQEAAFRAMGRSTKADRPRYVPTNIILDSTKNEAGFDALIPRFKKWGVWDNQTPFGEDPRFLGGGGF